MAPDAEAWGKIRLFVSAELTNGADVVLDPAQAHYLLRVMRLSAGERIRVFNGSDGEWTAFLVPVNRAAATVRLDRQIRAQEAEAGPWLAFAPVKKAATDFIVEKATELGASRLVPIMTERTIAQRVNVARLLATATEAAEQCGRLSVPHLAAPTTLSAFVAAWPARRALFIAHPHRQVARVPVLDAMDQLVHRRVSRSSEVLAGFLMGPEGGLTAAELSFSPACRVLRSSASVPLRYERRRPPPPLSPAGKRMPRREKKTHRSLEAIEPGHRDGVRHVERRLRRH